MNRQRQNGFTLLEILMAMVILGVAAAGVLLPFVSAAQVQREATCQVLAARLASDLMEQIVSTPFADIETQWGGYTEAEGQVKNASGVPFSDSIYSRFSRSVDIESVEVVKGTDCLIGTVCVNYDGRELVRLKFLAGP